LIPLKSALKTLLKIILTTKKIERHLAYIDQKIADYEAALDTYDKEEDRLETQEKIQQQKQKRENYKAVKNALKESGEEQISLTDPDAKAVILHRNIVNVGYNIQASVDAKNKLLVEFDTGDVNDTHALSTMALASKDLLKVDHLNTLADKGYHTLKQILISVLQEAYSIPTEFGIATVITGKDVNLVRIDS
jgi:hypothetical protein